MMKIKILIWIGIIVCAKPAFTQTWDPFFQSVVDQVSFDSLLSDLQSLESFGRKEVMDTALSYTGEWLIQSYQQMGYTNIQTDTFEFLNQHCYNIIVTKPGTEFPDKYLIIDGHYDTRTGPGVNDNGSGVAIILEIARLLQTIPTRYSIRFINFSAEEYGLVGSSHYVEEIVIPEATDIRLVFNIDEVGGVAGLPNDTIICERDESPPSYNNAESWAFTDTLANLTGIYSGLQPTISYAYGSDYVPFQANGEIITGFFEYNYSPYPHTIHDSLANLDTGYMFEIARASVAAGLYFASAYDTVTTVVQKQEIRIANVYPNPFLQFLHIEPSDKISHSAFQLYNQRGNLICNIMIPVPGVTEIETLYLDPGLYFYRISDEDGNTLQEGKLMKVR